MRIRERSVYVGPNLYALFPVIRLTVDLGELEDWPSAKLGPAFIDALLDALPGLTYTAAPTASREVSPGA